MQALKLSQGLDVDEQPRAHLKLQEICKIWKSGAQKVSCPIVRTSHSIDTTWLLDWFGNCLVRLATANNKHCHFKLKNRSGGSAKVITVPSEDCLNF